MRYFYLIIPVFFLALNSCSKHKGDFEEAIPSATISFSSPVKGAVYTLADSISVQALAISTETIHGYDLVIKALNDTTTFYAQKVHDHKDTLIINKKWKGELATPTDLEVQLTLTLDHEGHTKTEKIPFRVQ